MRAASAPRWSSASIPTRRFVASARVTIARSIRSTIASRCSPRSESVSLVVPFDDDTPLALVLECRPDVIVKGGDYTAATTVGAAEVIALGRPLRRDSVRGRTLDDRGCWRAFARAVGRVAVAIICQQPPCSSASTRPACRRCLRQREAAATDRRAHERRGRARNDRRCTAYRAGDLAGATVRTRSGRTGRCIASRVRGRRRPARFSPSAAFAASTI